VSDGISLTGGKFNFMNFKENERGWPPYLRSCGRSPLWRPWRWWVLAWGVGAIAARLVVSAELCRRVVCGQLTPGPGFGRTPALLLCANFRDSVKSSSVISGVSWIFLA
jgi:hypothetical protein